MKANVRAVLTVSFALLGASSVSAVTVHKLNVASPLSISDEEVSLMAKEMTAWMAVRNTALPWDVPCPEVIFVPGDKVQKIAAPTSGTYQDLVQKLNKMAPGANVMLVSRIDECSGVRAPIGCGGSGDEPFIITDYSPYNSLLWLHERGHNVGLSHAGEEPLESQSNQRIMFPIVTEQSVGKTLAECKKYMKPDAKLASVKVLPAPLALAAVALAPVAPANASSPAVDDGPDAVVQAMHERIAEARKKSGLTQRAYEVVGLPWIHGVPVKEIEALSGDDVESVRNLLDKPLHPFQVQAITALSIVGTEQDVALIEKALKQPMPAVNAGSPESSQAMRTARQIKLAAPEALGVLANKTKSASAVETLKNIADLDGASVIAGNHDAQDTFVADLSRYSVKALSLVDTTVSNEFVASVIAAQASGKAVSALQIKGKAYQVAPLSVDDVKRIKAVPNEIKKSDINAYFKELR